MNSILAVLAVLTVGLGGFLAVAEYRWRAETAALVSRLRRQQAGSAELTRFSEQELVGLPAPVQRYFRTVLVEGQPVVRYARLTQRGQFLVRPPTGWHPFAATEHFTANPGGFVWDSRIRLAPGLSIVVRDASIAGAGSMVGRLMAVWRVVSVENTPEIAAAALHRYLAEAVWLPTALLPGQGVTWTPLTDTSARGSITAAAATVSLDFHFGSDGLVYSVFTNARGRDVNGRAVPTPWQGRFVRYEMHGGMRIPMAGEVEGLLPGGPQLYWRGEITKVAFE